MGKKMAITEVADGQTEDQALEAQAERERAEGADLPGDAPRPELTVEPVDDLPGSPAAGEDEEPPDGEPAAPEEAAVREDEPPAKAFNKRKRGIATSAYSGPKGQPISSTDQTGASLATITPEPGEPTAEEAAAQALASDPPAALAQPPGEEDVDLARIRKSPTNPRIKFEEIEELAASIRKGGQYHAVLLRPNSTLGGYEIADGERRVRAVELNAQKHAGPKHVRALIRPMSDREFDEIRMDANLQREDLKPAEEGEGFQRLHATHGMKYSEIAARFGLGVRVVYNRVQLLALAPAGRKALDAGEFSQSIMLEISRRPTPSVQEEMLRELRARSITTLEAAEELFRVHFAFDLASAPFDKDDVFLAPAKGPCTGPCATCPHNSSNQKQLELGGQPPRPGVCTSPDGYRAKRDAHVEKEKEKAQEDGVAWLKAADVKRAFEGGRELIANGPYVALDGLVPEHPKRATWRQLLKDGLPKVYAAPDAGGRVHRLLDRAEAVAQARKLGTLGKAAADEAGRDEAEELRKRRRSDAREAAAAGKVVEAAVEVAEKGLTPALLRATCAALLDAMKVGTVEKRRGREPGQLAKDLAKMKEPQLRGLMVELAFAEYSEYFTPELLALMKALGLERNKLEKEVEQAELQLAAKSKKDAGAEAEAKPGKKRGSKRAA